MVRDRVDTARLALAISLAGAAVSFVSPTGGSALWAVSAYLYLRYLNGARMTEMPWMWMR